MIAGAGHAGGSAAAMLRQLGWTGAITLVGEEPIPPYQRPPLSKAWLKGEAAGEEPGAAAGDFLCGRVDRPAANTRRPASIARLRRWRCRMAARCITTSDPGPRRARAAHAAAGRRSGQRAGTAHRRRCGQAEGGPASGPGWRSSAAAISGLEAAASARALGAEVTIIEREARVLARVACETLSDFFQDFHRRQGVTIELGARSQALEGRRRASPACGSRDGRRDPVRRRADRRRRRAQRRTGARGRPRLRRRHRRRSGGAHLRPGHLRDRRLHQASVAAVRPHRCGWKACRTRWNRPNRPPRRSAAGRRRRPKCPGSGPTNTICACRSSASRSTPAEIVVRGDVAAGKFALFHLTADGTVQAVEAVNASTEFMGGRRIIQRRKQLTAARIADMTVTMQELAS